MKVNFSVASSEFEARKFANYIKNYTKGYDDLMFRGLGVSISEDFYVRIKSEEFSVIKEELLLIISSSGNSNALENQLPLIISGWESFEESLFDALNKVTSHEVIGTFDCFLLSFYKSGGYNVNSNTLWIYFKEGDYYGIIHELFHLHYWKIWDSLFKDYDRDKAWKLSEVVVELVLRDSEVSRFLIPDRRKLVFWDEVQSLADKVLPLWSEHGGFDSFLKESAGLSGVYSYP
ncbi:hypothetical protein COU61_01305 [Candidatus Pacearchaeota archaeon CG10_big_fil_rev_8_21_14_0_10_35_13]|nr:MAG: hypothetical protein COU61_01305 [Candidatus Pacearchaeota archaeon CG10_big_fil_rev_8_21_14_0_10_35_13]